MNKKYLSILGDYQYYDISKTGADVTKLPFSLRVLLENLLRNLDGKNVDEQQITDLLARKNEEISYRPYRVLMQDFTGVPAVVDLASMRDGCVKLGASPDKINPVSPVDLVIDHSVQVDQFGNDNAFEANVAKEFERNKERYEFLRWGQNAFDNFKVVPPGTGICHQVNLEYLAPVVAQANGTIFPDTCVGTDSHTTMINGLAVLGWGVGGIEAEAAMLGKPVSMLIPDVVGFKLTGKLPEGATATDLVLIVVEMLRKKGVVGKFVEFYGDGAKALPLADRATIANMAPEYGATCGFFAIDEETIKYLHLSGRDEQQIKLVEDYTKANNLWNNGTQDPEYTSTLELDLSTVVPSISGPKRPQDRILLTDASQAFSKLVGDTTSQHKVENENYTLGNGDIVVAAITSCTNTSNPSVMIAAGLVAKKALEKGLKVPDWVKTSLAPGSKVVTEYLDKTGLTTSLDALGFNLVGYGCTTCIGNSGPLQKEIEDTVKQNNLTVASVLSGNRNFEGRIHQNIKANYLASPPLVVAYALAGSMNIDITKEPIANGVYLKDIWPTNQEIAEQVNKAVTRDMFIEKYQDVFAGDKYWQDIKTSDSLTYPWDDKSTYIKNPPFFDRLDKKNSFEVKNANIIALMGDSVTTDHISPAGAIAANSPAADYLRGNGISQADFNSYGSRRGNHEVMMRGTFANVRIKNEIVNNFGDGTEGGYTVHIPSGKQQSIYDAAMQYVNAGTPLVVIAGKEYGTGSSRDWAAKGTNLLGIKAVVVESFERIHRSNLVGMGVLPCQLDGITKQEINLRGDEVITIDAPSKIEPKAKTSMHIKYTDGSTKTVGLLIRLDTEPELESYLDGGILRNVLKELAK